MNKLYKFLLLFCFVSLSFPATTTTSHAQTFQASQFAFTANHINEYVPRISATDRARLTDSTARPSSVAAGLYATEASPKAIIINSHPGTSATSVSGQRIDIFYGTVCTGTAFSRVIQRNGALVRSSLRRIGVSSYRPFTQDFIHPDLFATRNQLFSDFAVPAFRGPFRQLIGEPFSINDNFASLVSGFPNGTTHLSVRTNHLIQGTGPGQTAETIVPHGQPGRGNDTCVTIPITSPVAQSISRMAPTAEETPDPSTLTEIKWEVRFDRPVTANAGSLASNYRLVVDPSLPNPVPFTVTGDGTNTHIVTVRTQDIPQLSASNGRRLSLFFTSDFEIFEPVGTSTPVVLGGDPVVNKNHVLFAPTEANTQAFTLGTVAAIDRTFEVTSVTRHPADDPSAVSSDVIVSSDDSIQWQVQFNVPVDPDTFSNADINIAAASSAPVTVTPEPNDGTNSDTFIVAVDTTAIADDTELSLGFVDSDTNTDGVQININSASLINPATLSASLDDLTQNHRYSTAPPLEIVSFTRDSTTRYSNTTMSWLLRFNLPVTTLKPENFDLDNGGVVSPTFTSVGSNTYRITSVRDTSGSRDSRNVFLSLGGTNIRTAQGNPLVDTELPNNTAPALTYDYDTTPPVIESIIRTDANGVAYPRELSGNAPAYFGFLIVFEDPTETIALSGVGDRSISNFDFSFVERNNPTTLLPDSVAGLLTASPPTLIPAGTGECPANRLCYHVTHNTNAGATLGTDYGLALGSAFGDPANIADAAGNKLTSLPAYTDSNTYTATTRFIRLVSLEPVGSRTSGFPDLFSIYDLRWRATFSSDAATGTNELGDAIIGTPPLSAFSLTNPDGVDVPNLAITEDTTTQENDYIIELTGFDEITRTRNLARSSPHHIDSRARAPLEEDWNRAVSNFVTANNLNGLEHGDIFTMTINPARISGRFASGTLAPSASSTSELTLTSTATKTIDLVNLSFGEQQGEFIEARLTFNAPITGFSGNSTTLKWTRTDNGRPPNPPTAFDPVNVAGSYVEPPRTGPYVYKVMVRHRAPTDAISSTMGLDEALAGEYDSNTRYTYGTPAGQITPAQPPNGVSSNPTAIPTTKATISAVRPTRPTIDRVSGGINPDDTSTVRNVTKLPVVWRVNYDIPIRDFQTIPFSDFTAAPINIGPTTAGGTEIDTGNTTNESRYWLISANDEFALSGLAYGSGNTQNPQATREGDAVSVVGLYPLVQFSSIDLPPFPTYQLDETPSTVSGFDLLTTPANTVTLTSVSTNRTAPNDNKGNEEKA